VNPQDSYYFQQKCNSYFSRISDSCDVLIPPKRPQDLYENIAVWRELAGNLAREEYYDAILVLWHFLKKWHKFEFIYLA
jgi:hypothetical protein